MNVYNFFKFLEQKKGEKIPFEAKLSYGDMSDDEIIRILHIDMEYLKYIKNPSEKIQHFVLNYGLDTTNSDAWIRSTLQLIKKPSHSIILEAIKLFNDSTNMLYVLNYITRRGVKLTEEIQLELINRKPEILLYFLSFYSHEKPSERVQIEAVSRNGDIMGHIFDAGITPSEDVMVAAIKNKRSVYDDLINIGKIQPTEKMKQAAGIS